jgi:hypothetical protein
VVISAKLRYWWKRFDAFGRWFITRTQPVPGEKQILAEVERQRAEREAKKNG